MKFVSIILSLLFVVNCFAVNVSTNQIMTWIDTIESQQLQIKTQQLAITFYSNNLYGSYTNTILLKEYHKKELTKTKLEWICIALSIVSVFILGTYFGNTTQ